MSNLKDFIGGEKLLWWDEIYPNKIEITTSQDWVVPTDVTEVTVGICGGGGSGSDSGTSCAGGGGSKMSYHTINVTPGETITVTIGAGGLYPNGDGGSTSFGTYKVSEGGKGGANNAAGGNGGANGGTSSGIYFLTMSPPLIVHKVISGKLLSKQLFPVVSVGYDKYPPGGCGGGWDYPGIGAGRLTAPTGYGAGSGSLSSYNGTDGICVIWY